LFSSVSLGVLGGLQMLKLRWIVGIALLVPVVAEAQGRAFEPQDWYRLATVSSPALSPDGRLVAFTVTTVVEAENRRHSEVWVVPAAGGEPARYTSPATEASNPRFSHDGRYLFFTSQRAGGQGSTWALRMDVPAGEAVQVKDYPQGSMPRDGGFAVFADSGATAAERDSTVSESDPFHRMTATARPPHGAITRPLDPARFDGRHIVDDGYKANNRGFVANRRAARRWRSAQLFRQAVGDTARQQLTHTSYSHRDVAVSPDGRWIAFVADAQLRSDSAAQAERDSLALLPFDSARDAAPRNDADIFVVPSAGGAPRKVAELAGTERNLAWSPDGRRLAFVSSGGRAQQAKLWLIDAAGGAPRDLLGDWQYEPGAFQFLRNGELLLQAAVGGSDHVYRVGQDGRRTAVLQGRRRITGLSVDQDGRRLAYVATAIAEPTELFTASSAGKGERRLTDFNDGLNREIAWPTAERFTFTGVAGLEIEAWLQRPHGYEPGRRYPLVLYIHGGPHSAYGEGWFDEFHNLTGAGMWVLFTNPRGSAGYGAAFTYSTRGRWGLEDYQDLMQAVDIAARRPDVDSTRMGVTGGSYGGFMTAWITTKTNRFKAAQTDRMISNWWSWYGASDAQGLTEFEFYGKPWENPRLYTELSPITHVANVRTPTLIVQSEEDHRTPMADAEQWFMALDKQGVPVEFVRYPRSTHDLSRTGEPWLLVDRLARIRQWFEHWLKPGPATVRAESQ
jgi:dipeptidyl aminopeptidase/acylaminoacyl peptidase